MTKTIILDVIDQIQAAMAYLPAGCTFSLLVVCCVTFTIIICNYVRKKKWRWTAFFYLLAWFFFLTYIYCVLQLTVFSREAGNFGGVDMRFLVRWNEDDEQKAFLLANIVMYIPMGILLPLLCRYLKHILISLPIAAGSSIFIEAIQLKYQLGYCQLDDVVANSTGFLVGYLVFLIFYDVYLGVSGLVKKCLFYNR